MKAEPKDKGALRITGQVRSRRGMVYELRCQGSRLFSGIGTTFRSGSPAVGTARGHFYVYRPGLPLASGAAGRGGAFVAFTKDGDFGRVLEAELVDHIAAPTARVAGKFESAIAHQGGGRSQVP